jgi:hypothetical protein
MNGRTFQFARSERAQSLVITLLFITVLIGLAAAVLDVGAWYRADRKLQANADAAALAGAHELPESTTSASSSALDYADRNDGGLAPSGIEFRTTLLPNDTIVVNAERPTPGFFAKLFGFDSVQVRAKAVARAGVPHPARYAAPIGVDERHPLLTGPSGDDDDGGSCPCFGVPTVLDLNKVGPGAFRILNIDSSVGGTSSSTLGDWIRDGLDADMPLGWYYSDPGASFNSSHVRNALTDRFTTELLLPVYRDTRGNGAGFDYEVVGWVGFHVTGFEINGSNSKIYGWFERVVWEGIQSETRSDDDFGVRTVSLIE